MGELYGVQGDNDVPRKPLKGETQDDPMAPALISQLCHATVPVMTTTSPRWKGKLHVRVITPQPYDGFPRILGQYLTQSWPQNQLPSTFRLSHLHTIHTLIINTMSTTDMDTQYNTQWVSFHIRDRLEDGQVTVHHTVIEEYHSLCPPGASMPVNVY